KQRQGFEALARRARLDLEPRFERVVVAGPGELRLAAAEQPDKELAEMRVEIVERGGEPLAALLVERGDAAAQPSDRGSQVGTLVFEPAEPRRDLRFLSLGEQVDRAHRVALAHQ